MSRIASNLSRHALLAVFAVYACVSPCVAGTTGGIGGHVADETTNAPISGARVDASSASVSEHTTTDVHGNYAFISLPPDTYTLSVQHEGYTAVEQSGVTVQADVHQTVNFTLGRRTIANVISRARPGLLRPGQTIDVYSVAPALSEASTPLAGPGGVDQAYASLAALPGIYVPQGQQGWYQPIFIRGGDQDQIGYELDGVPVNRSYDNAPQSLLSSVGQQELQLYTGGANASSDGQGISGYINQVIKRGTRPAFGSLTYALGTPANYQRGSFEYGGASGDGRFTYYLATSLSDQFYRFVDPFNGASLYNSGFFFPSFQFSASGAPIDLPGTTLGASETRDREYVANFHYAIPHRHDSGSDDLQLLQIASWLKTFTYGSFNDFGGIKTFGTTFAYPDQFIYTGPLAAPLNPSAVTPYIFPNTPDVARTYQSTVNPNLRAVADNDFDLTKLQYQHNFGTSAYLRVLGYSTYSDWIIHDPIPVPATLEYVLPEHTFGGSITFADQLSSKHLVQISGSIASSHEYRYTTGSVFLLGGGTTSRGQIGGNFLGSVLIGSYTDGKHCYDQTTGAYTSCFASASQAMLNVNTGLFNAFSTAPGGSPAALNGAQWIATENGYGGLLNQVSPILTAGSIDDKIRPNDRLTLDLGARVERYYDRLVDEAAGYPARPFWFNAWNNEFCVTSANLKIVQRTIDPATGIASACPSGTNPINLRLSNDSFESNSVFEPRIAATYQLSSDTVLRASYGTYARPPNASWVQYGTLQQDLATAMAQKFIPYGFNSPQHDLSPDVSHNVDFSWEQHIHGTDMSFKVTPYYRGTLGQFENILLDASGNQSGVNIGTEKSFGVEFAFQKGDFARDGLSALLAFTYDYSRFRYAKFASGFSAIDLINQRIAQYNGYTSACASGGAASGKTQFGTPVCGSTSTGVAAAPFYTSGGQPDFVNNPGDIANPYWTKPVQNFLDPNGAYVPYDVIPDQPLQAGNGFGPPFTASLVLQYKHKRLAVTPSIAYSSGAYYGAPLSTIGSDPATGNTSTISIPNDFTGTFDNMGAFAQPWRLTGNLGIAYDLTSQFRLSVAMTGLFDVCHQRGYAWDRADFCAYTTLPFSVAPNSSTFTSAAGDPNYRFPYTVQNGNNNTQFLGTRLPFQAYITLQVKL